MTIARDRRVAIAEHRGLRVRQLSFLACLERNHEQGVWFSLALQIRDDQTGAVRTPSKIRRNDVSLAYPDLCQFAFRPPQRGDQPQFDFAGILATEEGDPAAVGRPGWVVIAARVGG